MHIAIVLLEIGSVCPAAKLRLAALLASFGTHVDDGCENLGEWGLTKVRWLNDPGRKRKDPHIKRYIAEEAQRAKRGKTMQNAIAGAGLGWSKQTAKQIQRQALSQFRAGCSSRFQDVRSIGVITDGVRLGKPARELTMTCVVDLSSGDVAALPPQDEIAWRLVFKDSLYSNGSIASCSQIHGFDSNSDRLHVSDNLCFEGWFAPIVLLRY